LNIMVNELSSDIIKLGIRILNEGSLEKRGKSGVIDYTNDDPSLIASVYTLVKYIDKNSHVNLLLKSDYTGFRLHIWSDTIWNTLLSLGFTHGAKTEHVNALAKFVRDYIIPNRELWNYYKAYTLAEDGTIDLRISNERLYGQIWLCRAIDLTAFLDDDIRKIVYLAIPKGQRVVGRKNIQKRLGTHVYKTIVEIGHPLLHAEKHIFGFNISLYTIYVTKDGKIRAKWAGYKTWAGSNITKFARELQTLLQNLPPKSWCALKIKIMLEVISCAPTRCLSPTEVKTIKDMIDMTKIQRKGKLLYELNWINALSEIRSFMSKELMKRLISTEFITKMFPALIKHISMPHNDTINYIRLLIKRSLGFY